MFPHQHSPSLPPIALPQTYIQKQLLCMLAFILNKSHQLHVDSTRIFGCCASCFVILVVPVDVHLWYVRRSGCKQVMSCIDVGQSLISVHS